MITQEKTGTVAKLLSISPYQHLEEEDPLELVNFKLRHSERIALKEYCEISGVKMSDILRDFVRGLIYQR